MIWELTLGAYLGFGICHLEFLYFMASSLFLAVSACSDWG